MSGKPMYETLKPWGDKEQVPGGVYVLRLEVVCELWVRVGRMNDGQPISFIEGEYLYLGSARRGLAARLLRHASRSWGLAPHRIVDGLEDFYDRDRPDQKKMHWHVDYILDQDDVEIRGVLALHTALNLEKELAGWVMAQPETRIVVARMGASDHAMGTHLLRVDGQAFWDRLEAWMAAQA